MSEKKLGDGESSLPLDKTNSCDVSHAETEAAHPTSGPSPHRGGSLDTVGRSDSHEIPYWMKECALDLVRGAYQIHGRPIIGNVDKLEAAELAEMLYRRSGAAQEVSPPSPLVDRSVSGTPEDRAKHQLETLETWRGDTRELKAALLVVEKAKAYVTICDDWREDNSDGATSLRRKAFLELSEAVLG